MSQGVRSHASTGWRSPPAPAPRPTPPGGPRPVSTLTALAIAGGIVAVTAGVALVVVQPAGSFTTRGSVVLDHGCATYGTTFGDIRAGTQITVKVGRPDGGPGPAARG